MAEACALNAHVRTNDGQIKRSKLYDNLSKYLDNKSDSNRYYELSKKLEFRDLWRGQLEFDNLGEPTFETFSKVAQISLDLLKVLKKLNTEISTKDVDYSVGIQRVQEFNKNHELKDDYLATLEYKGNGKYDVKVVERNLKNEDLLNQTITNLQLVERIDALLLSKLNIGTLFNTDGEYRGRYSTENATLAANGLYYLVLIAKGNINGETYAEEAGHCVVASLGSHPLVSRLINALQSKEVLKALLGNEYDTKDLGKDPAREVAGDLVGKALINALNENLKKHGLSSLIKRVADYAKKLFSKLNPDLVAYHTQLAQEIAESIAQGFISGNFDGNVDNNLSIEETLFSRQKKDKKSWKEVRTPTEVSYNKEVDDFLKALTHLRGIKEKLKSYELKPLPKSLSESIRLFDDIAIAVLKPEEVSKLKERAVKYLVELTSLATSIADDISESLTNQSNVLNTAPGETRLISDLNEKEVFATLRRYNEMWNAVKAIEGIIKNYTLNSDLQIQIVNERGETVTISGLEITKSYKALADAVTTSGAALNFLQRTYFLKFLERVYGSTYIKEASRVVLASDVVPSSEKERIANRKRADEVKGIFKPISLYKYGLDKAEEDSYNIRSLASILDGQNVTDISFYGAWLSSMLNCGDVILGICKLAIDKANRQKLKMTEQHRKELQQLEKELIKTTGSSNYRRFFKKKNDGSLNGYLLAPFDYGTWEQKLQERMKEILEEFKEEFRKNLGDEAYERIESRDSYTLHLVYLNYATNKMKSWHKVNSFFNKDLGMYVPNIDTENGKVSYFDEDYAALTKEEKLWLNKYIEWKTEVDRAMGNTPAVPWRAPLVLGTFSCRMKNVPGNPLSAFSKTLWDSIVRHWAFHLSEEDKYSFGLDNLNTEFENLLYDENSNVLEDINRIPVLGVRLRKNLRELNTDLLSSSMEYALMASNKIALDNVRNALEVGRTVLKKRLVNGIVEEMRVKNSRAYDSYNRHIDRLIYNKIPDDFLGAPKKRLAAKLAKLWNIFKNAGTMIALGFNPNPAVVNLGTGMIEIEKEARAGEYFTEKGLAAAMGLYFNSRLDNLGKTLTGNIFMDSKEEGDSIFKVHGNAYDIGKFLLYLDALNNYGERINKSKKSRVMRVLSDVPLGLYSITDNFMQGVPFLAMAWEKLLYDTKTGKYVNLLDIYKTSYKTNEKGEYVLDSEGNKIPIDYGFEENRYTMYKDAEAIRDKINRAQMELDEMTNSILDTLSWTDFYNKYQDLFETIFAPGSGRLYKLEVNYLLEVLREERERLWWNDTEENKFVSSAREVCNRLHGIYSRIDSVNFSGTPYGSSSLSMKGYALGMAERRLSRDYFNVVLGRNTEGNLVTSYKVLMDKDNAFWVKAATILLPFRENHVVKALKKNGYSDTQIANTVRTSTDFLKAVGLAAASYLLANLVSGYIAANNLDEDEEEENTFWKKINYIRWQGFLDWYIYKLRNELIMWMFPTASWKETDLLFDPIPVGLSATFSLIGTCMEAGICAYRYFLDRDYFKEPKRWEFDDEADYEKAKKEYQSRNRKMWGIAKDLFALEEEGGTIGDKLVETSLWDAKPIQRFRKLFPSPFKFIEKMQDYEENKEGDIWYREHRNK